MGIALLVIVATMFVASICVMMHMIILARKNHKHQVGNAKIDSERRERHKEVLRLSPSATTCAKESWGAICNDATIFTINKRKSNYSDERESEHFCENLRDDRIAIMNKIDMECHYGRY